jgi:hypothetical protein
MRLETGIAQAEADVYHQSAKGPTGFANSDVGVTTDQPSATTIQRERRTSRKLRMRRVRVRPYLQRP